MIAVERTQRRFTLDAGRLCLDFINTLGDRLRSEPRELLTEYADVVRFGQEAGLLSAGDTHLLTEAALLNASAANDAWREAIHLRETLYSICVALSEKQSPDIDDLDVLNDWHTRATRQGRITLADGGFVWQWQEPATAEEIPFDRPLWPIVYDAADLLLNQDLSRVRMCAAQDCAWFFIDTSRGNSRRWCSMQTCGNRAKVQNFRERKRARSDASGN